MVYPISYQSITRGHIHKCLACAVLLPDLKLDSPVGPKTSQANVTQWDVERLRTWVGKIFFECFDLDHNHHDQYHHSYHHPTNHRHHWRFSDILWPGTLQQHHWGLAPHRQSQSFKALASKGKPIRILEWCFQHFASDKRFPFKSSNQTGKTPTF